MSFDFEGSLPSSDGSSDSSSMKDSCTSDKDKFLISPHDSLDSPCPSYNDASLKEEEVPDVEEKIDAVTKRISRRMFNLHAFGTNTLEKGIPNKKKTKKILTQDEINKIIHILQHWDTGDDEFPDKKSFRIENRSGYKYSSTLNLKNKIIGGKEEFYLENKTGKLGKEIIAAENMFDAIYDAHEHVGHKKVAPTYNMLRKNYHSISESLVRIFINKVCPICSMTRRKARAEKGATTPIISSQFRARIQADLIDFRNDPRKNHNNVTMKWILVVKDHFTKFAWLRALTSKEAKLVAAELTHLFSEIGWPLIMHHDNGGEFIAQVVRDILKQQPFVCTVTGRPRKPSDQGSIERLNQDVKKVIDHYIAVAKEAGEDDPSWLDMIPKATSAINNSVSYGNHKLTPYHHVFGMDFDCPIIGMPLSDMAKLKTVDELAAYAQDKDGVTDFLKEQGYDIGKIVVQQDETKKESTTYKSADSSVTESNKKKVTTSQPAAAAPNNYHQSTTTRKVRRNAADALIIRPQKKQLDERQETFNYVLADLTCETCNTFGTNLCHLEVAETAYYDFCETHETRWWEITYLLLFGICQFHKAHRKDMMFLECCTPNSEIIPPQLNILDSIKSIVSVALAKDHYAVLEFRLEEKMVYVYDGLKKDINSWEKHISYILKQVGASRKDWKVGNATIFHSRCIIQRDGWNCGPIACMVMWGLFNPSTTFQDKWNTSNSVASFRKTVVQETKKCLADFGNTFLVRLRADVITIDGDVMQANTGKIDDVPDCPICLTPAIVTSSDTNDVTSLPQCSHLFHDNCIIECLKYSLCCPLCKKAPDDESNILNNYKYCQFIKTKGNIEDANKKRKETQSKQAEKMKRLRGACVTVEVGDLIRIYIPKVDKPPSKSMDVMGVVLSVIDKTKTITAATRHGMIGRGNQGKKTPYHLSPDQYNVLEDLAGIHKDLASIQDQVKNNDNFNWKKLELISFATAHKREHGPTSNSQNIEWGSSKCKCKAKANGKMICNENKCHCRKQNFLCGSGCGCGGTCQADKL